MVDLILDLILNLVSSSKNTRKLVNSNKSSIDLISSMISLIDNKGSLGKQACKILKAVQT